MERAITQLIFDGIKAIYWKKSVFSKTGTGTTVYLPAKQTNKVNKYINK